MALTPADVANRTFRQQAYRGYLIADVDAFCDEVESEIARLLRENEQLRQAPAGIGSALTESAGSVGAVSGVSSAAGGVDDAVPQAALRTLQLAQRTADEAIAEAQADADSILTTARAEADSTLATARAEADSTLATARAEADSTVAAARASAAAAERESAALVAQTIGDLEGRRDELQGRIDELRAFEREYRSRLMAYLQGQVRELASRAAPDDGGSGLPSALPTVDWAAQPEPRELASSIDVNAADARTGPAVGRS